MHPAAVEDDVGGQTASPQLGAAAQPHHSKVRRASRVLCQTRCRRIATLGLPVRSSPRQDCSESQSSPSHRRHPGRPARPHPGGLGGPLRVRRSCPHRLFLGGSQVACERRPGVEQQLVSRPGGVERVLKVLAGMDEDRPSARSRVVGVEENAGELGVPDRGGRCRRSQQENRERNTAADPPKWSHFTIILHLRGRPRRRPGAGPLVPSDAGTTVDFSASAAGSTSLASDSFRGSDTWQPATPPSSPTTARGSSSGPRP